MKRISAAVLAGVATFSISAAWSKGSTLNIEIRGDGLASPIAITDPSILGAFNIWNGPGVSVNGQSYIPGPDVPSGAFIDWRTGIVTKRPPGLQRLEVTFLIGRVEAAQSARKYVVAYELDTSSGRGFIYLPKWSNDLIWHGVEGNWFHAAPRWDEMLAPIVRQRSTPASGANRDGSWCTIGLGSIKGDGTIELRNTDERGRSSVAWRFAPGGEDYADMKQHMGSVAVGEEIPVSCWPPRS